MAQTLALRFDEVVRLARIRITVPEFMTMSKDTPSGRLPHPSLPWALFWIAGYIGFTQIPAAMLAVVWVLTFMLLIPPDATTLQASETNPLTLPGMSSGLAMGLALAQVLSWVYSLILLRVLVGRNWIREIQLDHMPRLADTVAACALVPGMLLVGNSLVALLPATPKPGDAMLGKETLAQFESLIRAWPWWMAVLIIAVGPALGEELFCRGFLGRGLVARYGTVAGIGLTSLLFGVMHIIPAQAMYAGLLGILLHCLALSGRSLWLAILAHFLNNALSVLAACDDSPVQPLLTAAQQAIETQPSLFLAAGILLCVGVMRRLQTVHDS